MNEIFYNRIKNIPLEKGTNYKSQLKKIFENYKDLNGDTIPLKGLIYTITSEYPDTVIVEITNKYKKGDIKL